MDRLAGVFDLFGLVGATPSVLRPCPCSKAAGTIELMLFYFCLPNYKYIIVILGAVSLSLLKS